MAIAPILPNVVTPSLGSVTAPTSASGATGQSSSTSSTSSSGGFANLLQNAIGDLNQSTTGADAQVQALATGQSSDYIGTVSSMEQSSMALDLAAQVRTKLVDAYQEIFRMQV